MIIFSRIELIKTRGKKKQRNLFIMSKQEFRKWFTVSLIVVITLNLFLVIPNLKVDLQRLQASLISASGIIAGILLAFLSQKMFQIIQGKNEARKKLNELSDKMTSYRKILYRIMSSHDFWVKYGDVNRIKQDAPGIRFRHLHNDDNESKAIRRKFWLYEYVPPISNTTVDLFLAMEQITGVKRRVEFWAFDENEVYTYDLDYLYLAYNPSNQIWYYLVGRYNKHTHGLINESGLSVLYTHDLPTLMASIDSKYKEVDFSREVIGEISSTFHESIIPEMIRLTELLETSISKKVKQLFMYLVVILLGGVGIPLVIQLLDLNGAEWGVTACMVVAVIVSLTLFLFDIFGIAENDSFKTEKDRKLIRPN